MSRYKLLVYAVFAGILSGVAATFALLSAPGDASGWWQVAIAIAGLPILFYELEKVGKELKKAEWKPDIDVGLAYRFSSVSDLKDYQQNFPSELALTHEHRTPTKPEYLVLLVVQNQGRLAAKYVRIQIEFKAVEEVAFPPPKGFADITLKDYVFEGDPNWVIFPKTARLFALNFISEEPRDYSFRCTVWAEGLDTPVEKALTVRVVDRYGPEEAQQESLEMVKDLEVGRDLMDAERD